MEPLSKARIKLIQSLQHKKFRLKYDKFIVEGLKITKELITERPSIVEDVYISNPDYQSVLEKNWDPERLHQLAPQQMHQLSQMSTPPGVLAVCYLPPAYHLPEHLHGMRIFYLDAIRDPGNLGTILRIADWFGIDAVVLSPDCVDVYNHKVLQSSMGSALRVRSCELSGEQLAAMADINLYACDMEGRSIDDTQPPEAGVFVLGNESLGVSDSMSHLVKEVFAIPGSSGRGAESLNVASAAAIMAHWWTRGGSRISNR